MADHNTPNAPEEKLDNENKEYNFVKDGDFYIHGLFDYSISRIIFPALVKAVDERRNQKKPKPIKFYIDSDGGYSCMVYSMLSLIEQAKKEGIEVHTYVFGRAYSCGSLLACSGTKGKRYVGEFAEHLCHLGSTGTGRVINPVEAERMSERVHAHFSNVKKIYRKYAKIKNLDKIIHDDCHFIRGKEILSNGLADQVV